jgi:hypothetical protein
LPDQFRAEPGAGMANHRHYGDHIAEDSVDVT